MKNLRYVQQILLDKNKALQNSQLLLQCSGVVILDTQAIYNIYVYIMMYDMNSLGTQDGVW